MPKFVEHKKQSPERDAQRDYYRSITGLELRAEALVRAIRDAERGGMALTAPLENLAKGLEGALKTYRDAKSDLRNPKD